MARPWLAKAPAQKGLIVLDACGSGASEAFRGGDRTHETVLAQLEHATGHNTIAAAPAGRDAYERHNGLNTPRTALRHKPSGIGSRCSASVRF